MGILSEKHLLQFTAAAAAQFAFYIHALAAGGVGLPGAGLPLPAQPGRPPARQPRPLHAR